MESPHIKKIQGVLFVGRLVLPSFPSKEKKAAERRREHHAPLIDHTGVITSIYAYIIKHIYVHDASACTLPLSSMITSGNVN